ncbi:glycosyltransferase family 2 protein [Winogradskyella sp.]|uniref:glycosyltransferase family 2 protein n=1 Tax=Winogradskyella sp. TaxID=1883156 RepID=UPI003AB7435B
MRKGYNPTKGGKLVVKEPCDHRVIIPLHIPHENDYFKDAYKIFELCLFSILKTASSKLKISIISNKCSQEVNQRLIKLYDSHNIDELIIEREGIGKINSLLKALRTIEERLVTITDADVLFLDRWEDEVVQVFKSFPKAGAVCPVPVYRKHLDLTANIWSKYLFSSKLKFRAVKDVDALENFAQSLGWTHLPEEFGDSIGTLKAKDNTIAVLGCSHFVATYKSEVFKALPKDNSAYLIDGDSEFLYMDKPVVVSDGYRLSTYTNNAYHLGNVFEPWMQDRFDSLKERQQHFIDYSRLNRLKKSRVKYFFTNKLFKRIIKIKPLLKIFLKNKGLTKIQVFNYVDRQY